MFATSHSVNLHGHTLQTVPPLSSITRRQYLLRPTLYLNSSIVYHNSISDLFQSTPIDYWRVLYIHTRNESLVAIATNLSFWWPLCNTHNLTPLWWLTFSTASRHFSCTMSSGSPWSSGTGTGGACHIQVSLSYHMSITYSPGFSTLLSTAVCHREWSKPTHNQLT